MYVLITASMLPTRYSGIKIVVAGSRIVKLSTALATIKKDASSSSQYVASGLA